VTLSVLDDDIEAVVVSAEDIQAKITDLPYIGRFKPSVYGG
jgi:hypothetical protein